MAGIDTTSPHYKGKYANIYEVNKAYPSGGSAGDYVDILGFAHYWNPDRSNWCVNEERDEYWDELLASAAEGVKRLETGLAEETSERANADAELSQAINIVNKATQENSRKISAEMQARVAADTELWGGIREEAETRSGIDARHDQAIEGIIDRLDNLKAEDIGAAPVEGGLIPEKYLSKDVLVFSGYKDDMFLEPRGLKSYDPQAIYFTGSSFVAFDSNGRYYEYWYSNKKFNGAIYYGIYDTNNGVTPSSTKIYIDTSGNKIYRWNGDSLILLSGKDGGGADLSELLDSKGNVKYDLMPDKVTNVIDAFSNGNLPVVSPKIIVKSMEVTDYKDNNKEQNSAVVTPIVQKDDANKKDYVKVEIGSKIKVGLAFMWTSADNYKVPTEVTDKSDWEKIPEEGEESGKLELDVNTTLVSSGSLTAEVSADKTGIMVSGSNVVLASGKDTAKRTFEVIRTMRMYYGKTKSVALKESDVEALSASTLVTSRSQTLKDITTDSGEYFVIAYPTLMGALKSIVLNGQEQLGGFTQSIVSVTNALNYTQNYYVYRSNNDGVFNKDTLVIS